MQIAVIGSGIGGLGIAIKLAQKGHSVTVYEKNECLGGRASILKKDGFTFDMGPSWYLMPDVFEKFFNAVGENIHEHLSLKRLSPSYRVFFEGETQPIDMPSSSDEIVKLFESIEKGAGTTLRTYLQKTKKQYHAVVSNFLYKDIFSIKNLVSLETLKAVFILPLTGSLDSYVKKFFKSDKIHKLLEYTMVFLGASPYNAPAIFSMMSYVDFGLGVFYPQGGIYTLVEALEKIGRKNNVEYVLNTAVQSINCAHGRAQSVTLDSGETVDYDCIVSNADMHFTETKLLSEKYQTYPQKYWDKVLLAPSGILMYLGVKGTLPSLEHHTLYFAQNWQEHFDSIFMEPSLPLNPSFYICTPSKTDTTVAPSGYENMFVFVPVASKIVSQEEFDRYADVLLDHIQEKLGIDDLKERIVTKEFFGPHEFQQRYNSFSGTALGLAHTLGQSAFFRPRNKSRKVSNLYYVGAGVHPGIGMPVCLISAELTAERIEKETI